MPSYLRKYPCLSEPQKLERVQFSSQVGGGSKSELSSQGHKIIYQSTQVQGPLPSKFDPRYTVSGSRSKLPHTHRSMTKLNMQTSSSGTNPNGSTNVIASGAFDSRMGEFWS